MKNIKSFDQFNESVFTVLGTAFFGGLLLIRLLRWLVNKALSKAQKVVIKDLLDRATILAASKTGVKNTMGEMEVRDGLNVYELGDKYVIRSAGKMFSLGEDIRITKKDKLLTWGKFRVNLSDDDYEKFLKIIKDKLN